MILQGAAWTPGELAALYAGGLAVAVGLRLLPHGEKRSLGLALILLVLALLALALGGLGGPGWQSASVAAAVVVGGLGLIQVAAALVFRAVLPPLRLAAPRIVHDLTVAGLSVGWGFVLLRDAGVDPAQLFTTSALVTAVLAFAMQDTLGNVLGGVVVQMDSSLRVGDWIRMDDVSGRVADVGWRYTAIELRTRERVIVPNAWLMKNRFSVVRPASEGGPRACRRAVVLPVDAQAEPTQVVEALERCVVDAAIACVASDPPPSALLTDVASGVARYTLRYWLTDPQNDDPTDSAVRVHALAALARAGIALAVPREEHLTIKENDSWRAAGEQRDAARRLAAIQRTEMFARLPLAEQEALASHLVHAPFAPGDVMTRQGAVAHWLYLIVHGRARVYVDRPSGRVELAELGDGSVFGEMGMLTGEPRSATVVALTAVDCYRLDKVGFAQVLHQRPDVAQEVSAIIAARHAQADATPDGPSRPAGAGALLEKIWKFFSVA